MRKICTTLAVLLTLVAITYLLNKTPVVTIDKAPDFQKHAANFELGLVARLNEEDTIYTVMGSSVMNMGYDFYVSDDMRLMVEGDFLRSLLSCSVLVYSDGDVIIMKGDSRIDMQVGSNEAIINGYKKIGLGSMVYLDGNKLFVPVDDIAEYLSYKVNYYFDEQWVDLELVNEEKKLPEAYDMRDYGRVTPVRDQGRYGTCWAFASLGALETTIMPKRYEIYSTDHMTMCNSYDLDINRGGEHTMSIAYLAAWQGPVFEKDDPYGDGVSDSSLEAVLHLEEALVINEKDLETIKSAVYRYGAIETSLYLQMEYVDSVSQYYSEEKYSYYYDGDEEPNHDVVIVGWDDNYPKENFTIQPAENGAFICKNSWGEAFGEDGYFYVSYYDKNICQKSVVYTRVGDADNFDKIYQSDLLGWVGQMGFGKEEAYFANVYTAGSGEGLSAVSFYATGKDTEFEVYVVNNFEDTKSFDKKQSIVAGSTKYAGYYTVKFPKSVELGDNETFAVVVRIKTPGAIHPIAIEYAVPDDERTSNFDISDGQGYISLYGEMWHSAEETENCNVCLKAFTNKR